ncbi:hypothetical protein OSTOST_18993, partial [Ostertagia ostertagi]
VRSDTIVWISSVSIPSTQCGWLSSRTGKIGSQNCNNLMPFVCEKGTQPYIEPVMWRAGIVVAVVLVAILVAILFLLALCWCIKSRKRNEDSIERKNIIRASIKLQRKASAPHRKQLPSHQSAKATLSSSTINAYGDPFIADSTRSPTETVRTECSDSLSTDRTYDRLNSTDTSSSNITETSITLPTRSRNPLLRMFHLKTKVSNPNPYEEIPTMNTFQPPPRDAVHLRDRRSDTSCSSTVTGPCSTCPTESERDSTLTDGSWSEQSSTVSESTVQNRRLLPPKPEPPRRYEPQAPRLAPSRSNPNLQSFSANNRPEQYRPVPVPTPSTPLQNLRAAPQRSLVDLHNPLTDQYRRPIPNNGFRTTKPVIETAM